GTRSASRAATSPGQGPGAAGTGPRAVARLPAAGRASGGGTAVAARPGKRKCLRPWPDLEGASTGARKPPSIVGGSTPQRQQRRRHRFRLVEPVNPLAHAGLTPRTGKTLSPGVGRLSVPCDVASRTTGSLPCQLFSVKSIWPAVLRPSYRPTR